MKLFDSNDKSLQKTSKYVKHISNENVDICADVTQLNKHIRAFNSLSVIDNQIAKEDFNFINKGNYILYNEYIKSVTANLGMKYVPVLAQETVNELPTTALNHHIALEGFIGDLWSKIKQLFSKLYNTIKEFFTKYFTRLGRVKNRLNNLSEVLNETDKDLSEYNIENVPGSIKKAFPYESTVNINTVKDVTDNVKEFVIGMETISKEGEKFSNRDIIDKDFVNKIDQLKNSSEFSKSKINDNNANKKSGTVFNEAKFGENGKINKEPNKENKTLSSQIKDNESKMNKEVDKTDKVIDVNPNLDNYELMSTEAVNEYNSFNKTMESTLNSVKGKNLANGKVINDIVVNETDGIEITTEEKDVSVDSVSLGGKSELITLVKASIDLITKAEQLVKLYGKTNDNVMKKIDEVDKIIATIDKIDIEKLGKYKKILVNKVKVRLNLTKTFFNNYNKVCKNALDMTMDTCDGVSDYAVLSLKYFK